MTARPKHRHRLEIVRRERSTGHPVVKRCECGREIRRHRGRWVVIRNV